MTERTVRVWANGCYDVYHFGHANFLRQAKMFGDYVIAGLHGDLDIANNKAAPVVDEEERARIIAAVEWVDEIQTEIPYGNVLETLNKFSCDFCVHGDDIAHNASGQDIYALCKEAGKFKECKRTDGISTTMIIDRILLGAGTKVESSHLEPSLAVKNTRKYPVSLEYYQEMLEQFSSTKQVLKETDEVLYVQGVFDLFHSGHVGFLEKCKSAGDKPFLVAGVFSDDEVFRVFGGYPVTNMFERALALTSCKYVNKVIIGVPFEIKATLLDQLKVHSVYHGRLWDLPADPYTVAKEKGIFYRVDSESDKTAQNIIQQVIKRKEIYLKRNSTKSESVLFKIGQVKSVRVKS